MLWSVGCSFGCPIAGFASLFVVLLWVSMDLLWSDKRLAVQHRNQAENKIIAQEENHTKNVSYYINIARRSFEAGVNLERRMQSCENDDNLVDRVKNLGQQHIHPFEKEDQVWKKDGGRVNS